MLSLAQTTQIKHLVIAADCSYDLDCLRYWHLVKTVLWLSEEIIFGYTWDQRVWTNVSWMWNVFVYFNYWKLSRRWLTVFSQHVTVGTLVTEQLENYATNDTPNDRLQFETSSLRHSAFRLENSENYISAPSSPPENCKTSRTVFIA